MSEAQWSASWLSAALEASSPPYMRRLALVALLCAEVLSSAPICKEPRCWENRVIYQILTDRFATSSGSTEPCSDLTNYCGGTWRGIYDNLDYIAGLGVDAIWISPVLANTHGGYAGYWAKSLTSLNEHFGTPAELELLIDGAHQRGLLVMIDVVTNHMGQNWTSVAQLDPPFNSNALFHDCSVCQAASSMHKPGCVNGFCDCWVDDYNNAQQLLFCQLFGLPDLNQSNPIMREV